MASSPTDILMDVPADTPVPTSLASTSSSHPPRSIPTPTTDTELYSSDEDPGAGNIAGGSGVGGDDGSMLDTPNSSQQSDPNRNPGSSLKGKARDSSSAAVLKGFARQGEGRGMQNNDDEEEDEDIGNDLIGRRPSGQMETMNEGGAGGLNEGTYAQGGIKEDRILGEKEFDALNEEIGDPFDTDEVDSSQQ